MAERCLYSTLCDFVYCIIAMSSSLSLPVSPYHISLPSLPTPIPPLNLIAAEYSTTSTLLPIQLPPLGPAILYGHTSRSHRTVASYLGNVGISVTETHAGCSE